MNPWSTDIFMISMNSKTSKPNAVCSYRTLLISFVLIPPFTGGLTPEKNSSHYQEMVSLPRSRAPGAHCGLRWGRHRSPVRLGIDAQPGPSSGCRCLRRDHAAGQGQELEGCLLLSLSQARSKHSSSSASLVSFRSLQNWRQPVVSTSATSGPRRCVCCLPRRLCLRNRGQRHGSRQAITSTCSPSRRPISANRSSLQDYITT